MYNIIRSKIMKKIVFFGFVAVIGISPLFSQEETWSSVGFEFGNSIESADKAATYIGAPGFNLNVYSFSDRKDIGFFCHYSFLFSVVASGDGNIRDYNLQFEFIVGVGFRHSFSENLKLQFGAGIDWMPIFASYSETISGNPTDFSKIASNLGIGADLGIKYDITDYFYINGGLTFSYMFSNYTSIDASRRISATEEWS